jgi:NADH-quinone oxidoreductase subunit J
MSLELGLFYLFSTVLLLSAFAVVVVRNTVYSVLFLILTFVNAACLFVLSGSEYLAMLLIVVYVGAIAVLFLFVVMMLNVDKAKKNEPNRKRPLLLMITALLFSEIFIISKFSSIKFYEKVNLYPIDKNISNVKAIGNVLYTDFILPFQISGIILFVAMIGAIVLTIKDSNRLLKKQNIADQVLRSKYDSIEIVKVKSGQNLNI